MLVRGREVRRADRALEVGQAAADHRGPAHAVGPGVLQLHEFTLHLDERRVERLSRREDILGVPGVFQHGSQIVNLAAQQFDLVDDAGDPVPVLDDVVEQRLLGQDVRHRTLGVRVAEDRQLLGPHVLAVHYQSDRVGSRRLPRPAAAAEEAAPDLAGDLGHRHPVRELRLRPVLDRLRVRPPEVPPHAVEPVVGRPVQGGERLALRVLDPDLHFAPLPAAEPVVDRRPVGRVLAHGPVLVHHLGFGDVVEAVRVARREQVRAGGRDLRRELLHGAQVVEDPVAAPVRPRHEVVEVLLDDEAVVRRRREVRHEELPTLPVVVADVDVRLRAEVEETRPHRVLEQVAGVVDRIVVDPVRDLRPRLPEVVRPVGARVEVADLVVLDRDVRLGDVEA